MATDNDDDLDTTGLSAEEIAALNDDSDESANEDNDADEPDLPDADADEEDDVPDADEPSDTPAAKNEPEGEDADESAQPLEDDSPKSFTAQLQADHVEDYDNKLKEITDKRDALLTQLEAGDIDLQTFVRSDRELSTLETDLRIDQTTAENAAKQNRNIAIQKWNWEQEQFFSEKANKIYEENKPIGAAFDSVVKDLASKPENANKTGMWFLKEADRQVRELFGKKADSKTESRKPNLDKVPKTLNDLPTAAISETNNNEFAYLDKLDGMQLEVALRKMTPEQEARYLQSA